MPIRNIKSYAIVPLSTFIINRKRQWNSPLTEL
jgi:hypothetical protein